MCEIYKGHLALPELGVLGSSGFANPRHFQIPVAWYEDKDEEWTVTSKF